MGYAFVHVGDEGIVRNRKISGYYHGIAEVTIFWVVMKDLVLLLLQDNVLVPKSQGV